MPLGPGRGRLASFVSTEFDVKRLRPMQNEWLTAQNRDGRPNLRLWLGDMIAYAQMANPDKGRKLRGAFERAAG